MKAGWTVKSLGEVCSLLNRGISPTYLDTGGICVVLSQYVKVGGEELDPRKLSPLLKLKYNNAISDAWADLGRPEEVGYIFAGFQKYLYQPGA